MSLEVIDINNIKWDEIIKLFDNIDIYYTREYVKAFQIHGDGEPILFYYKHNDFIGINVVMKRKIEISKENYFDLITPYGYGGWLFKGHYKDKLLDNLNKEYIEYCNKNNIITEFVRFHPILNNAHAVEKIYDVIDLGNTINIELKDKETIWTNIKSKNRNVIRKAIKTGVTIKKSNDKEIFEKFIEIYNTTMDRDDANSYYYFKKPFYDCIKEDLKNNSIIYYAEMDNKIIGASIIMYYNKYVHYHLSGALREYMTYAPMNLLLYIVACDFCEKGYETMHLGGGIGSDINSGLYKFKESFNKNGINQFSIGKKIFDKKIYNELIEIRKNKEQNFDINDGFFPIYRKEIKG